MRFRRRTMELQRPSRRRRTRSTVPQSRSDPLTARLSRMTEMHVACGRAESIGRGRPSPHFVVSLLFKKRLELHRLSARGRSVEEIGRRPASIREAIFLNRARSCARRLLLKTPGHVEFVRGILHDFARHMHLKRKILSLMRVVPPALEGDVLQSWHDRQRRESPSLIFPHSEKGPLRDPPPTVRGEGGLYE